MLAGQGAKQGAYDQAKAAGASVKGRRPADEVRVGPAPSRASAPRASTTDVDSRRMKAKHGFVQGYNAQAAVTDTQVIVGTLVTQSGTDHHLLPEVLAATKGSLAAAGITDPLVTVLAEPATPTRTPSAPPRTPRSCCLKRPRFSAGLVLPATVAAGG